MTLEEVLPALKGKKPIRRKGKTSNIFLCICDDKKIRLRKGPLKMAKSYGLSADDILATDWEIVQA